MSLRNRCGGKLFGSKALAKQTPHANLRSYILLALTATLFLRLRAMTRPYLFIFAQAHDEFRIPELQSIAEIYGFKLDIPSDFDRSRPFAILQLEEEEHAILLARRCILIKCITIH